MQHVKFLKALPGILEGSVRQVDENSAAILIERGDAEAVKSAETADAGPIQRHTRGNLTVTQVAGADLPDGAQRVQTGVGAGSVIEAPGADATKAELVAYADGKLTAQDGTPLTAADLEALTKAELRAQLGL